MHRRTATWALICAAVLGTLSAAQTQPITIESAKRVEKYADASTNSEVTPTNAGEVVLVVDLSGISLEDFQATPKTEVAITAGDRRFDASLTLGADYQMLDGDRRPVGALQELRRVVVIVPRDVLDFSLRFGSRAPVSFKADANIAAQLP